MIEPIHARDLGRYVTADYFASLLWTATTSLLPLIVLAIAGAKQSAYFFLSWTVAYTLYLLSRNLGMSLVTEGARAPQRLYEFALRTLAQSAKIVVPLAVAVALLSPVILRLLGPDYVDGASILLPLLVLSAIPNVVISTFLAAARVQRRMRAVVVVTAAMSISTMGLSVILLDRYGLTGVGVAWLVAQSLIAIALLLTELRAVWLPRIPLHRLPHPSFVRNHATGSAEPALAAAQGWERAGEPRADPDLGVMVVRSRQDHGPAVLRYARTELGARSLARHGSALVALDRGAPLGPVRHLVPDVLERGVVDGRPWLVETYLEGVDAREVAQRVGHAALFAGASAAIREVHVATAAETPVDDDGLAGVGRRADRRAALDGGHTAARRSRPCRARPGARAAARGARRAGAHHVLRPWRLLARATSSRPTTGRSPGIVDWERGGAPGLAAMDVMTLILTGRVERRRREFGPVVRDLLRGDPLTPAEQSLFAGGPGAGELPERTILLLTWLHHAASNLQKRNHYRANTVWVTTNVHYVLEKM